MAQLIADMFISLDGFALGIDVGPFFGYSGPGLDNWVSEELDRPQQIIMGRVTYELMAKMSSGAADKNSSRMNELSKLVFSHTLQPPLSWANTRVLRGDLAEQIRECKRDSESVIRSIGSVSLVKGMMEIGLVDRLRLMIFPIVLGAAGREPFFKGHSKTGLELISTKVLDSRLVLLEYRPLGGS